VSTTHTITGAIVGVGHARGDRRPLAVAQRIVLAWVLTLPAAGLIGALAYAASGWIR
jgi:PiT family inorganic phosphate transporter